MQKLKVLSYIIGVVQLVLGALYLIAPLWFLTLMGHSSPADIAYPLGMLAARFIAYGIGMFVIASDPQKYRFWVLNMILIQLIDLGVGVFYTFTGVITLAHSGFPMFNAALFSILLWMWRPAKIEA
jgi:hypothetical protein